MQIRTLLYTKLWTTVVGAEDLCDFWNGLLVGALRSHQAKSGNLKEQVTPIWWPGRPEHLSTLLTVARDMQRCWGWTVGEKSSGTDVITWGGTPRLPSSGRWWHQEGAAERLANEGKWRWAVEAWTPEQVRSGRQRRNVYLQPWGGVFSFITCAPKSSSDVSNATGYAGREHHMLTKGVFGHHTNQHCLLPRPEL